jgi:AGZA family xanthine/uracil permease-like MFS transporter
MMVYCLSDSIKNAISVGIGMFIAYIGLQNAGIIVGNNATQVTLGDIGAATPILAIAGTIITAVLLVKNIKGALLIGILLITIIGIPCGITTMQGVISTPPSIEPIFCKIEWSNIFTTDMLLVVCTLLFLDLFDTMGTLIGVCNKANIYTPDGKIPRLKQAFLVDALATTLGAVMGTSTVTTFAESATGVSEGGRSGLTAFVTAMCFLVALVFAPLFLSIPSAATAPVLILVGVMMMGSVTKIDFTNFADAVPAFVCIIFMPLSYSISNGILFGHLAFVAINLCSGNHKRVTTGMIVLAIIFLLRFLL